ncbi:MAG: fibronectin type III domain-containing protein, partial [Cyanobacteria bacterium J06635_1]
FEYRSSFDTFAGFSSNQRWLTGDFNGDGKDDLVNVYGNNGEARAWMHLSNGAGFEYKSSFDTLAGFWDSQRWVTGNFDGDGKNDLVNVYGALPNPPEAPSNLEAQVDGKTITLSWQDNSSNEEGFEIIWQGTKEDASDHNDSKKLNTPNQQSYTITGLKAGFRYCIRVRAFNKGGDSDNSSRVCATIPVEPREFSLRLTREPINEGFPPYTGRFPAVGVGSGHLLKIHLPRVGFQDTALRFVKPGFSTADCDNPSAVVEIVEGATSTPEQMRQIYDVAEPRYSSTRPIPFEACFAQADQTKPLPQNVSITITVFDD